MSMVTYDDGRGQRVSVKLDHRDYEVRDYEVCDSDVFMTMTYIMLLLEEFQVGNLIASQITNDILPPEKVSELAGVLLELFYASDDLLPLFVKLRRRLLETLQFCFQVADKVGHVGGLQKFIFSLGDGANLVIGSILGNLAGLEVEKGEDQVTVEVFYEGRQEIVVVGRHDCGLLYVVCYILYFRYTIPEITLVDEYKKISIRLVGWDKMVQLTMLSGGLLS